MAGKTIIRGTLEVPQAKNNEEAVNLGQVKDLVNRYMKDPVKVATTGELTGTYSTGILSLNYDINSLDGVTLSLDDSILVKDQLDKTQNGIYTVTALGTTGTPSSATASIGTSTGITGATVDKTVYETVIQTSETFTYSAADTAWKDSTPAIVDLTNYGISVTGSPNDNDTIVVTYVAAVPGTGGEITRRQDFDEGKVILNNTFVNVMEGVSNGDTRWTIVSDGVLTVGTSSFTFVKDIDTTTGSIKVATAPIVPDGVNNVFNLSHNFNLSDEYAYILKIRDASGNNVWVDDIPKVGDEKNSITVTFSKAPEVTESFKAYILGLE